MSQDSEILLYNLAQVARTYLGLKEEGVNRGKYVDDLNHRVGAPMGSPWCAAFVSACVAEVLEDNQTVHSTFTPSAHVRTLFRNNEELVIGNPVVGAIVCWGFKDSSSGHCGIVVEVDEEMAHFITVEGNTDNAETIEREGGVVALHNRENRDTGKFQLLGFIKPF